MGEATTTAGIVSRATGKAASAAAEGARVENNRGGGH
jgi:hypothetical protein